MKKIFKVELEGDVLEKFLKIKRSVGLKKDTEVFRFLISLFFERGRLN